MGRIKKNVKKAMLMIIEIGAEYLKDDMGADWTVFTAEDLQEAVERLLKKVGQ